MQVKTYTHIWAAQKTLHSIGDLALPFPIPFNSALLFIAAAAIWCPLLFFLTPIEPTASGLTAIIYIAPPLAAAWIGNKPIFEGKTIFSYVGSQLKHLNTPKYLTDLKRSNEPPIVKEKIDRFVWSPNWEGNKKKNG